MPDLAALNSAFGIGTETDYSPVEKSNISERDISQLKNIMNAGEPTGIDTKSKVESPAKPATPEYMKEYQEILEKKFEKTEDDKTDYTKRAIEELGSSFSHINTRDAFENELFTRQSIWEYLDQQPNFKILEDVVEGRYPSRFLISENIKSRLDQDDPNFEENLKARVDQYFDEDELNAKGKARYGEIMNGYKNAVQNAYHDAQRHASQELIKLNEFKANLTAELKTFKPGGVELGEELGAHIANYISAGKNKEWHEQTPPTPKEAAQKEIMMAIMSDPKALAEWINLLDIRGRNYGSTSEAQKFFKNN
ncbi:hypothetical protein [Dyadobacter sp. CY312]|uniref:hypothetical protein n=1 Tax=Dyadobacter sp. CY312 TaxID=2907303 RepID=UPI001F36D467|nr:hypothetical protein [Dyadobacter sp. CY312]MCE7039239.1 hypothetical protein [Dyadobacter sp. CY312]